jgi:hypothetical protein
VVALEGVVERLLLGVVERLLLGVVERLLLGVVERLILGVVEREVAAAAEALETRGLVAELEMDTPFFGVVALGLFPAADVEAFDVFTRSKGWAPPNNSQLKKSHDGIKTFGTRCTYSVQYCPYFFPHRISSLDCLWRIIRVKNRT